MSELDIMHCSFSFIISRKRYNLSLGAVRPTPEKSKITYKIEESLFCNTVLAISNPVYFSVCEIESTNLSRCQQLVSRTSVSLLVQWGGQWSSGAVPCAFQNQLCGKGKTRSPYLLLSKAMVGLFFFSHTQQHKRQRLIKAQQHAGFACFLAFFFSSPLLIRSLLWLK